MNHLFLKNFSVFFSGVGGSQATKILESEIADKVTQKFCSIVLKAMICDFKNILCTEQKSFFPPLFSTQQNRNPSYFVDMEAGKG